MKKLNFTEEQYKRMSQATEKEVMASLILELRSLAINEALQTTDKKQQEELEELQAILEWEAKAVLGNDETASHIKAKVQKVYSPMLKAYYATK